MADTAHRESDLLKQILTDGMSLEQERAALQQCVAGNPALAAPLLNALVAQKHRCRTLVQQAETRYTELLTRLDEPPWVTASFLRFVAGGDRALVAVGNRRVIVAPGPRLDRDALGSGVPVFLNASQNVILDIADRLPQPGVVGEVSHLCDATRAVVRGPADEEIVVDVAARVLDAGLVPGELLLYDRESYVAYDKIQRPRNGTRLLEELPLDMTVERLGGLDGIFNELTTDVGLLFRPELVERFHLQPSRGVLLCGPPGTGKTSLVRALGEYLCRTLKLKVKVLLVRPGIHRSMWFGASERHVRDLFREASDLAGSDDSYVLLFFDDVDHLGSRDHHAASDVDTRLLPCFLQEIDAIRTSRLLLIGATNREDLLDEALLRPGRFGRIFRTGRPDRRQAREIVRRHLPADLPIRRNGDGTGAADDVIENLLAVIYSPNGELSNLATLTFRDGSRRPLRAAHVMSGALIAAAVEQAKRRGCVRVLNGGPAAIEETDLHASIARELTSIAERLRPGPALGQMLGLPPDHDVVRIELQRRSADALSTEYFVHARCREPEASQTPEQERPTCRD
jgi:proteasome-associated ATPase